MADGRDVPESVLLDILLFLPVISLLRFKTVCRSWCSLIESSFFVKQHLNHNSEMLMLRSGNELSFFSGKKYEVHSNSMYEQIFPRTNFDIYNSCNGIIYLAHYMPPMKGIVLSLWNPATKQVRRLPKPAVGPIGGHHISAFGFDKKTNDYKIVRIIMHCFVGSSLQNGLVQVYSMRNDSWRTIYEGDDFPIVWTKHFVDVASNGEMFLWVGMPLSLTYLIFYFDLANEGYGTVPLPPDHHANVHAVNLAFLSGKITYVRRRGSRKTGYYYEIWMMDEFGKEESWNKVYRLEEPILPCEVVRATQLLKNGEFILMVKHGGTGVGLYLYDLVTQEKILLLDDVGDDELENITNYSESLVSLKSIN